MAERICVDPEALRSVSGQLSRAAGDLQSLQQRLERARNSLDMEARRRANIEGELDNVRGRALFLCGSLESMAHYLTGRAYAFEDADGKRALNWDLFILDNNPLWWAWISSGSPLSFQDWLESGGGISDTGPSGMALCQGHISLLALDQANMAVALAAALAARVLPPLAKAASLATWSTAARDAVGRACTA